MSSDSEDGVESPTQQQDTRQFGTSPVASSLSISSSSPVSTPRARPTRNSHPHASGTLPSMGPVGVPVVVRVGPHTNMNYVPYPPDRCSSLSIPQESGGGGNHQYRLQMNNLRPSSLQPLPALLEHAKHVCTEAYRQDLQARHGNPFAVDALSSISFERVPLVEVTFNHNRIDPAVSLPLLLLFLQSNDHIRSFEMLGNMLTDDAAGALGALIRACPHLRRLKLADNQLGDVAGASIGEAIFEGSNEGNHRVLPRFLQLNVGGNRIKDAGVRSICEASLASGMQILGLRGLCMSPRGWAFCGALCAAYHSVEDVVRATAHGITTRLDDSCSKKRDNLQGGPLHETIHAGALPSHAVSELQLKFNPMTDACMDSFVCSALQQQQPRRSSSELHRPLCGGPLTSTITSLSLACCTITASMCQRLALLLTKTLLMLQHIDLSHNPQVGDAGLGSLVPWLQLPGTARHLTSLSLEACGLSITGLVTFSKAIQPWPSSDGGPAASQHHSPSGGSVSEGAFASLRVLNISGNVFGVHATPTLIGILARLPTVEKLYLRGCHFGGPYLEGLVHRFLLMSQLSDIDFTANFSSGDVGSHWGTLIMNSSTIRRLLLTDNNITNPHVALAFSSALLRSPHRQLVVFQVGGKSKTEPLGNVIAPAAHTVILKAIQRNRQQGGGGGGMMATGAEAAGGCSRRAGAPGDHRQCSPHTIQQAGFSAAPPPPAVLGPAIPSSAPHDQNTTVHRRVMEEQLLSPRPTLVHQQGGGDRSPHLSPFHHLPVVAPRQQTQHFDCSQPMVPSMIPPPPPAVSRVAQPICQPRSMSSPSFQHLALDANASITTWLPPLQQDQQHHRLSLSSASSSCSQMMPLSFSASAMGGMPSSSISAYPPPPSKGDQTATYHPPHAAPSPVNFQHQQHHPSQMLSWQPYPHLISGGGLMSSSGGAYPVVPQRQHSIVDQHSIIDRRWSAASDSFNSSSQLPPECCEVPVTTARAPAQQQQQVGHQLVAPAAWPQPATQPPLPVSVVHGGQAGLMHHGPWQPPIAQSPYAPHTTTDSMSSKHFPSTS